jgi:hypothetical protein
MVTIRVNRGGQGLILMLFSIIQSITLFLVVIVSTTIVFTTIMKSLRKGVRCGLGLLGKFILIFLIVLLVLFSIINSTM